MSDLKSDALDSYNPFTNPLEQETSPVSNQPAVLPLSGPADPPPYLLKHEPTLLQSKNSILTVADLQRRQQELDDRAAQLDLRERQQQQQELWRAEHGYGKVEVPNWPPFPKWCCCKPFVRIDFQGDIPLEGRSVAFYTHCFWLMYSLLLLINMFAALSYFIVSEKMDTGAFFGVSIIVTVVIPPAAFFAWNRPLYKALKNNSSFNFFVFFPCFGLQIILIFIQVLGIDYLGACGWINSLKTLQKDKAAATFMICVASLFSVSALFGIFIIIRAHAYYRSSGANSKRAKQELAREIVDQGVRSNS